MPNPPIENIQLQACLADPDATSEYRFLVGGKDIKYITIEPGVIPPDDIPFEPAIKSRLPAFPTGNWNYGHVARYTRNGSSVFTKTARRDLPGVKDAWHDRRIDHLQLTWIGRMRQNIRLVTCTLFENPVVYKFAAFPWQIPIIEKETTAYSWIHGHGIGPRFLGHVTEAGRVIGFLIEHVSGRIAGIENLDKCQRVLKRLYALGLKHGDINRHNFLAPDGNEAVLIDFEVTIQCDDEKKLSEELEGLPEQLEATEGMGGEVEED